MNSSQVRRRLALGQPVFTAKACYQDPELVELMASSGFDAMWICLEHKRIAPDVVYAMIQACRLGQADALMRVKPANYTDLLWLLESGARGIMLPRVRHPDEVREVVAAMNFPPDGRRGFDAIHAEAEFGRKRASEYIAEANRENFLVVQIEELEVLPHIEAIAAMPGVDVLFVGPGDLALGLGKNGEAEPPEVRDVIERVAMACRKHGKVAGIPCSPDDVPKHAALGYRFFNVVSDYRCVISGIEHATNAVSAAGFDWRSRT